MAYWYDGAALAATRSPVIALFWCLIRFTTTTTTILKKRCLDHNNLNNYRPVSNLCFIAKILEKFVLSQVSSYHNSHNLSNTCQSAYCPDHSTEAALLKVVSDLFLSLNKGNISELALLDFSSAFDTIDHPILVHRQHTDF